MATKKKPVPKSKTATAPDIYQTVTDRLIEALEAGTAPWQKPWESVAGEGLPINATTGKPYNGVNVINLAMCGAAAGFSDPRWCTYKQATEAGWQVRKGEKSAAFVVFYKQLEIEDAENVDPATGDPERIKIPLIRATPVFNAEQIDGVPQLDPRPLRWTPAEAWERLHAQSGAEIRHGGNQAFYRHDADYIQLPPREAFPDAEGYYGTAAHELVHWTGHANRQARPFGKCFGTPDYAREELVAEIGSTMLCAQLGIPHDPDAHASYVGQWLEVLKGDKRAVFKAAAQAQAACDWLKSAELAAQLEDEMKQREQLFSATPLRQVTRAEVLAAAPAVLTAVLPGLENLDAPKPAPAEAFTPPTFTPPGMG